jgi:ABC-type uncharacterized transport system auxiliary subunit
MRTTALVLLAPLALLAAGCLGTSGAQQQAAARKRTFALEAAPAARLCDAPRFAALKIRACRALPPFDARAFIVRRPAGEMAEDFYNGWIAAPQDLLRAQVARRLEQTGLFASVCDAQAATRAPLGLEAVAGELCLDFSSGAPAAVVSLRLLLLDERAPAFALLFTAERSGRAAFDPADPAAPALAYGCALSQALDALAQDLARAPLPAPAP